MSTITQKATVTQVPFGGIEIEGLLLENGEFAIAQRQLASLFQVLPNSVFKWIESKLGKGSSYFQVKTNREIVEGKRVRSNENALSLTQFETLLRKLDREGNQTAREMVDSLIGLSLTQLFSDAFDIKFDKEDRQAYLKARIQGKVTRRTFTDSIKDWLDRNEASENTKKFIYVHVSDALNVALFGKKAKVLCEERNCDNKFLRDTHSDKDLKKIDSHEEFAMKLVDKLNIQPLEAIKQAIEFYK